MIALAGMLGLLIIGMASIITTIVVGYGFGFTLPDGTTIDTWVFPSAIVFWFILATVLAWREDKKIQKSYVDKSSFDSKHVEYEDEAKHVKYEDEGEPEEYRY